MRAMMPLARLIPLAGLLALPLSRLVAGADADLDAAARADDARQAATIAADKARLDRIFSDDLVYVHGSGHRDTKASYQASLLNGKLKYLSFEYESRDFYKAAPGIVLMRGRVHIHSAENGKPVDNYLAYLAVWRNENGVWRFLAWQSCHVPVKR